MCRYIDLHLADNVGQLVLCEWFRQARMSPIELAFKMRSLRMVKALVRHGVDVKKGNPNIQRAMENEADFREGVDYIRHVHIFRYYLKYKLKIL